MVTGPRVVFFGTPQFAVPTLEALVEGGWTVAGVVTQPDRPRGRGQRVSAAPVKALADAHGLPVLQPDRLKTPEFAAALDALRPDIGVVAAYGKLLPQSVIDRPARGMVNVHASLLPRWRGAAPVHRAILAGDHETGVTIMRVVLALDAGPTIARESIAIDPDETSADLEERLARLGARLLVQALPDVAAGHAVETPQDEAGVTYAARLDRADSPIDWARPARSIHDQIRGLHPWPLAAASLGGRRVIVRRSAVDADAGDDAAPGTIVEAQGDRLVVAAAPGRVRLLELQPEGRRATDARAFINGARMTAGQRFE